MDLIHIDAGSDVDWVDCFHNLDHHASASYSLVPWLPMLWCQSDPIDAHDHFFQRVAARNCLYSSIRNLAGSYWLLWSHPCLQSSPHLDSASDGESGSLGVVTQGWELERLGVEHFCVRPFQAL